MVINRKLTVFSGFIISHLCISRSRGSEHINSLGKATAELVGDMNVVKELANLFGLQFDEICETCA